MEKAKFLSADCVSRAEALENEIMILHVFCARHLASNKTREKEKKNLFLLSDWHWAVLVLSSCHKIDCFIW